MLDNWQRVEQVIKCTGAASVSAFAREIGLNRGENLYQIKRGNNGISRDLAESITAKYPDVSKAWLLTGEGEMLPGKSMKEKYDIPFFKTDAAEFLAEVFPEGQSNKMPIRETFIEKFPEPAYYISFPMMKGTDFATFTFSDAMHPEIPRGTIVFLQYTETSSITPGNIYLVESSKFQGIRYLRREVGKDTLRLVPADNINYDEITLPVSEVRMLFLVKGVLINK